MNNLTFISLISLLGSVISHVEMVEPPPRNSKNLKGVRSGLIDYGMNSPVGADRPFPCLGYGKGPISESVMPGQSIETKMEGQASHNGGHCQFSLSYDGKTFVALKTVLGDCLVASKSYSVPIPKSAPSGDAVFAWSWINRTGNREFYMNCADIKILGDNKGGSVKGHEIVVAHVDAGGEKTYEFPEEFSDDYGKQYFKSTPVKSISPSGSKQESGDNSNSEQSYDTKEGAGESSYESPKDHGRPAPPGEEPAPPGPPPPAGAGNGSEGGEPSPDQSYSAPPGPPPPTGAGNGAEGGEPSPDQSYSAPPAPGAEAYPPPPGPDGANCQNGIRKCISPNQFATCDHGTWINTECPQPAQCQAQGDQALCV